MQFTTSFGAFPAAGQPRQAVLDELRQLRQNDIDWKAGRTWSLVYYVDEDHLQFLKQAHNQFFSENTINPFAFESVGRLERDIIRMTADLLHGGEEAVGVVTGGGSESIFLAVYAYREWARKRGRRRGVPEMVVPASIHPAFFKAAHMLGIRLRQVPLGEDRSADAQRMAAAVNERTILLACSAPAFPYGVVDRVEEVAAVARRHDLPLHVDACVGGFMLPWVEALGYEVPRWDFRVEGVTSMSTDLHKFAYGAKGASVLLYRRMDFLRHQFFILPDWCGGIYASPTVLGTRSVGPMAAGWAALRSLGREGYLRIARRIMEATDRLRAALAAIPEIEVLGAPHMNLLAYTTRNNRPDLFVVADQLEARGWMVDRQQNPNSIHLTLMSHNIEVLDRYLADLRAAVAYAKEHPEATARGNAALYGLMARLPFKGMVEDNVRQVFEGLYGAATPEAAPQPEEVPAWQGWLNRLLAAWQQLVRKF